MTILLTTTTPLLPSLPPFLFPSLPACSTRFPVSDVTQFGHCPSLVESIHPSPVAQQVQRNQSWLHGVSLICSANLWIRESQPSSELLLPASCRVRHPPGAWASGDRQPPEPQMPEKDFKMWHHAHCMPFSTQSLGSQASSGIFFHLPVFLLPSVSCESPGPWEQPELLRGLQQPPL